MVGVFNANQLVFAVLTGFIPSFIWLFFWMRRGRGRNEPVGLVALCFMFGALMVMFADILEKTSVNFVGDKTYQIITWTVIEEVLKFAAAYFVALRSIYNDDAVDPAMYMMAAALGFAALENVLYILRPVATLDFTGTLLTGGLRFFGSTLLHTIASGFAGIIIGLTPRGYKTLGALFGLGGAIFLHSTFNFYILKNTTASFLQIYGYLWVAAIITFIILEKLRRISPVAPGSTPPPTPVAPKPVLPMRNSLLRDSLGK